MRMIRQLPSAEELRQELSLTPVQREDYRNFVKEIKDIISGDSRKKIICIGPCSADNENAVLDYMSRLVALREKVYEKLLIVPRIYTSKPRTTGTGYKGLLHRPKAEIELDNLYRGIKAMRGMHLHVIQETGMFGADEMLYPEAFYYISDLLSYATVGARSVEDQQHRLVSSGMDVPIGMKNPTSGDVDILLNAIVAAQSPQTYLYHGWECESGGNEYAHGILRGYQNSSGKPRSNYHYEMLCDIHDQYLKRNLRYPSVIVDCNHNNSRKQYDEQIRIAKEVFTNCRSNSDLNSFVKGIMVESYICDGAQMIGEGIYGKSITDPCLGWEKTERLVLELAEMI